MGVVVVVVRLYDHGDNEIIELIKYAKYLVSWDISQYGNKTMHLCACMSWMIVFMM